MSNYADLLVSFFSLVKNNNGFFKSEKQAAFMLKMTDGHYVTTQQLHFGEYDARTRRNTAMITWAVTLDNQGVVKMEKTTSKGTQVYFERTQEYFDKLAAQKAAAKQEQLESLNMRLAFIEDRLNTLRGEFSLVEPSKDALMAAGLYESVIASYTAKIEEEERDLAVVNAEISKVINK